MNIDRPPYCGNAQIIFQLVDVDYCETFCDTVIRVFGVTAAGHSVMVRVYRFAPYFYVADKGAQPMDLMYRVIQKLQRGDDAVLDVTKVTASSLWGYSDECRSFLKISVSKPSLVYAAREALREEGFDQSFESNVDIVTRFMVDTGLVGCCWVALLPGRFKHASESLSRCQIEVVTTCESLVPLLPSSKPNSAVRRVDCQASSSRSVSSEITETSASLCLENRPLDNDRFLRHALNRRTSDDKDIRDDMCTYKFACRDDNLDQAHFEFQLHVPNSQLPVARSVNSQTSKHGSSKTFAGSTARAKFASQMAAKSWNHTAPVRVLSFDIEVCGRRGIFPEPEIDPVIQVASVVHVEGSEGPLHRAVFVVGSCAKLPLVDVVECSTETELLSRWAAFVRRSDPDIITGYNIDNFDFPYVLKRARLLGIESFAAFGRVKNSYARSFVRSAVGTRSFTSFAEQPTILVSGRVVIDMFGVAKREHKLRSYSLNEVAQQFLKERKDDVHYTQIAELHAGDAETRAKLAAYCVQDAMLPLKLMQKWMTLTNYVEMARVTGLPIRVLVSRGQQLRVFAQILREARASNFIVPTFDRHPAIPYAGGLVLEPDKGFHKEPITVLDFSSLYPSIMIAYNLCYSTLLTESRTSEHSVVDRQSDTKSCTSTRISDDDADSTSDGCTVLQVDPCGSKSKGCISSFVDAEDDYSYGASRSTLQPEQSQAVRKYLPESQSAQVPYIPTIARPEYFSFCNSDDGIAGHSLRNPKEEQPPSSVSTSAGLVNVTPSGSKFVSREVRKGLLPQILESLIAERALTRQLLRKESNADVQRVYDGRQLALKVTANAVYGFTGAQTGMLPCVQISESVTAYGRNIIERARRLVESRFSTASGFRYNARVIYGDTDSLMIAFGVKSVAEAVELGKEAAAYVTQEINMPPLKLEFEKVYEPFLLLSKKRYVGLSFSAANAAGFVESRGIETKRRDNCQLVSELVTTCLHKLLVDKDEHGAVEECRSVIASLAENRVEISKLVISKELTNKKYCVKLPHTELAKRIAERNPGEEPKLGDRVPYVILAGKKSSALHTRAENPEYAALNELQLDVEYYLERQLLNPLKRILGPIVGEQEINSLFLRQREKRATAGNSSKRKKPSAAGNCKRGNEKQKQAKLESFGIRTVTRTNAP